MENALLYGGRVSTVLRLKLESGTCVSTVAFSCLLVDKPPGQAGHLADFYLGDVCSHVAAVFPIFCDRWFLQPMHTQESDMFSYVGLLQTDCMAIFATVRGLSLICGCKLRSLLLCSCVFELSLTSSAG